MFASSRRSSVIRAVWAALIIGGVSAALYANHSWGNYHWSRASNPFTLELGDNVSSTWDEHLAVASSDWSVSDVLDTTVVTGGTSARRCKPTSGRVEVCAEKYGFNGWPGIAQIWVSGDHITQAITKMNDSYFDTSTYGTYAWRQFVMCQEVGHTSGLGHQDESFSNPNLGSCVNYTDDPDGSAKNQVDNTHPNLHDYQQLGEIYAHLDSPPPGGGGNGNGNGRGKRGGHRPWTTSTSPGQLSGAS